MLGRITRPASWLRLDTSGDAARSNSGNHIIRISFFLLFETKSTILGSFSFCLRTAFSAVNISLIEDSPYYRAKFEGVFKDAQFPDHYAKWMRIPLLQNAGAAAAEAAQGFVPPAREVEEPLQG